MRINMRIKKIIIRPHLFWFVYGLKRKAIKNKDYKINKKGNFIALRKMIVTDYFWEL